MVADAEVDGDCLLAVSSGDVWKEDVGDELGTVRVVANHFG